MSIPHEWVVVTGGNRGIGVTITSKLLTCGFGVIALHKTQQKNELLEHLIQQRADALLEYGNCNVGSEEDVQNFFHRSETGGLDLVGVVHCAGVQRKGDSIEDFRSMFETNVYGPYLMTKRFAEYRRIKFPHTIATAIFIGSTSGLHGDTGNALYAASKAGLHRFVTGSLPTYADVLRMNVIICGPVGGERSNMDPDALEFHRKNTPTGRLTTPDEVAHVVAFYIKERHLNLHGSAIALDGARTRHKI
ncbi:MAG: acetoacetyl-CoA reductase [Parcubacteria group bacterium Gr01-1014_29]|nr:MAG: acetoacetyl-CoA reductase [Parcubacteria group bacterium Gr01-1014_29]